MKLHYWIAIFMAVEIGAGMCMIFDMNIHHEKKVGWLYHIGYIVGNGPGSTNFSLGITMLGIICSNETRGMMFGFSGILGAVMTLIIDQVGEST